MKLYTVTYVALVIRDVHVLEYYHGFSTFLRWGNFVLLVFYDWHRRTWNFRTRQDAIIFNSRNVRNPVRQWVMGP